MSGEPIVHSFSATTQPSPTKTATLKVLQCLSPHTVRTTRRQMNSKTRALRKLEIIGNLLPTGHAIANLGTGFGAGYTQPPFPTNNYVDPIGRAMLSSTPTYARGCLCNYVSNWNTYKDPNFPRGDHRRWPYAASGNCNETFRSLFSDWSGRLWQGKRIPCTKNRNSQGYYVGDTAFGGLPIMCKVPVSPSNLTLMAQLGLDISYWIDHECVLEVQEGHPSVVQLPFECFDDPIPAQRTAISYICGEFTLISKEDSKWNACGPGPAPPDFDRQPIDL
ncbi:MAG: hypothetical protein M1835_005169 [Candelina submexicana]|nr:MAG: hypothetical protein M1835_005169 [Candelina submexicana]